MYGIKKEATIDDYARMCKFYDDCKKCPIGTCNNLMGITCDYLIRTHTDKANEIILKWIKEHPIKTRQSEFLKMFPNAEKLPNNVVNVNPCQVDKKIFVGLTTIDCITSKGYNGCAQCQNEYWLAEVDENDAK